MRVNSHMANGPERVNAPIQTVKSTMVNGKIESAVAKESAIIQTVESMMESG